MKSLILFCIVLLTSSCSGVGTTIRTNSNDAVDLAQYKTFDFFQQLDTDSRYETLMTQHLKQATIKEMTQRGFVLDDSNPDLLINFHTNVETKQNIHQIPSSSRGGYYGNRGHLYYDAWIGYETYIENYTEGTLNIDIVDRQQNKMVWQGIAINHMTEKRQENMQATLEQAVFDIFTEFPITIAQ